MAIAASFSVNSQPVNAEGFGLPIDMNVIKSVIGQIGQITGSDKAPQSPRTETKTPKQRTATKAPKRRAAAQPPKRRAVAQTPKRRAVAQAPKSVAVKRSHKHQTASNRNQQAENSRTHVKREERLKPSSGLPQTLSFWQGTMSCDRKRGKQILRLTVSGEGQDFAGVFEIAPLERRMFGVNYMSMKMHGVLDAKSGKFQLKPAAWIEHPSDGKPMNLEGVIAADNKTMKGHVAGGGCSEFTATYFELAMPPVNQDGLIFKVADKSKPLTDDDCVAFVKWVNSGKQTHLPTGYPSSYQLFNDEYMRAVLGKSLFQWGVKDDQNYRNIASQCGNMAANTLNVELSEESSKVGSMYVRPLELRKENKSPDWFNVENQYLYVHMAFKLVTNQKDMVKSLPQTLESIATLTSLMAENRKKNSSLAWLQKKDFEKHENFLMKQQVDISDNLVKPISADLDSVMDAKKKIAAIDKISMDAFKTTVKGIPAQHHKLKDMLINKRSDADISLFVQEQNAARHYSPLKTTKYLEKMPSSVQVMTNIQGSDKLDIAARQYAALSILMDMVVTLSPRKPNQGMNIWLSPEEKELNGQYYQTQSTISAAVIGIVNPTGNAMQAQYDWLALGKKYAWSDRDSFRTKFLKQYFSDQLRTIYTGLLEAR